MKRVGLHGIMSGDDRRAAAGALRVAAAIAEPGYRAAMAARNAMFDFGLRKPARLPAPVISVGNLTAGGTGKTPMVAELVGRLLAMGARPAVLMRGYMPDAAAPSDEQAVLLAALGSKGNVPIACDSDRSRAAKRALSEQPDTNVFILDDGFQHRQVHRNLDLVLVDATEPFGYGHVLPRGLLREPRANLRRAHGVIVTHADQCGDVCALDDTIKQLAGTPPLAHAAHVWSGYVRSMTDEPADVDALRGATVAAISGIGNPHAFEKMARRHCGRVAAVTAFADHHHYTAGQLRRLLKEARAAGAAAVVTTEKDWVKWRPLVAAAPDLLTLPVYRPVLQIGFIDGSDAVYAMLRQVI